MPSDRISFEAELKINKVLRGFEEISKAAKSVKVDPKASGINQFEDAVHIAAERTIKDLASIKKAFLSTKTDSSLREWGLTAIDAFSRGQAKTMRGADGKWIYGYEEALSRLEVLTEGADASEKKLVSTLYALISDVNILNTAYKSFNEEQEIAAENARMVAMAEESAANAEREYQAALEMAKQMSRADVSADVASMSTLQLIAYTRKLRDEMRELENVKDPTEEQSQRYDQLSEALARVDAEMHSVQQDTLVAEETMLSTSNALNAINNAIQGVSNAKGLLSGILNVIQAIGPSLQQLGLIAETTLAEATAGLSLILTIITTVSNAIQTAVEKIKNAISSILGVVKRVISAVISGVKKVMKAISSLVSQIQGSLKKALDKVGGSAEKAFSLKNLKRTLNMLTKYIFGFRSFFFLYRRLRKYIGEGIENLVQFQSEMNETNHAITELKTSLLYLKNAWAAAFAPIINAVYPILVRLIDLLATVGNAIARFIAMLTGQSTVLQALRIDAGDYADSLNDIGSGAGNAAKAQDKLNDRLASFDDLNVLGVDDDKNKSGAGGGGGADDLLDPNTMFERVKVKMDSLIAKLREAWETGDAFELGDLFATRLEQSLEKAHEWLTGEGRNKVLKIANLIGTFFDGMLSHKDLGASIGRVIGDAFDLVCDTINTIITPERMMKFGEQLAGAMNTAIPMMVPKLGEALGNLFRSAIAGFYGWVTTADWKAYGQAIADGFNNFLNEMSKTITTTKGTKTQAAVALNGWDMLGISITEFAQGMINMLGEAIARTDWTALGEGIGQLLSRVDLSAIWVSILNVGNGIKNGAKGVWSAFEASAPEGATRALSPFVTILENLPDLFTEIMSVVKQVLPTIEQVNTWLDNLPETIENIMSTVTDLVDVLDRLVGILRAVFHIGADEGEQAVNTMSRWQNAASEAYGTLTSTNFVGLGGFGALLDTIDSKLTRGSSLIHSLIDPQDANEAEESVDSLTDHIVNLYNTISGHRGGGKFGIITEDVEGIKDAFNNTTPAIDSVKDSFDSMANQATTSLKSIPESFNEMKGAADTQSANIKGTYDTTFENIKQGSIDSAKVVQDNFLLASDSIKDSFIQTWDEIKKSISEGGSMYVALTDGVNNTLKSLLNGMINGINTSITKPLQDISKSFNILRTLDVNGTRPFAGIPYLNVPTIPALAQGAVIPPNNQFLAVLGDQRSGTNIEAPLDTIKQAVGEEFAPYAEAIVDAVMQVVSAVNNKELKIGDKEIGRANDRYNTQRSIIRGTML